MIYDNQFFEVLYIYALTGNNHPVKMNIIHIKFVERATSGGDINAFFGMMSRRGWLA